VATGREGHRIAKKVRAGHALFEQASRLEEPLHRAAAFVRVLELAERPHDDEMQAVAFVATEARQNLETLQQGLHRLFARLRR
jgi:hypothetical protein